MNYRNCRICPRNCGINREILKGYCGSPAQVKVARAGLHFYEEPFLSGKQGSGTVFFTGCSLGCVFCQNRELSQQGVGIEISTKRLADIFLEQQERGAHNINLVTGTHYTPSIAEALKQAKHDGLLIPVIWNSSAYEKKETLELLRGLVDIWLPDLKTLSLELAERYFHAPDYPDVARNALEFMVEETELRFEGNMMRSGVVVRHLMLPGALADTKNVLRYLHDSFGERIWISLMNQYTPMGKMPCPELERRISRRAYDAAVDYAIDLGIEQCMIQEGGTVSESFIPDFDGTGVLGTK